MSTAETLVQNPLENEPGLSEEDNIIAARNYSLRNSAESVKDKLRFENQPAGVFMPYEALGVMPALRGIAKLDAMRVKHKGVKHYKANTAEYQVQAVKDAAAEGVKTNFGEK